MIGRATARWLLAAILLSSLALDATALDWGVPNQRNATWSYDEIAPVDHGLDSRSRHGGRYPPLHFDLLRILYAPVRAAHGAGWLALDHGDLDTLLRLIGRSLSVLMAVGTVYLAYRIGRLLLVSRRAALLAAAIAALPVPFVRFSKTINLDVPYTFWFALSLYCLLRVLDRQRWRDYLAFAAAMAAAICTKDQAACLYLAVPVSMVVALAAERSGLAAGGARYLRAMFDPRPLASLALALGLFALVHRLHFGLDDFRFHVATMFGRGSSGRADYPATLAGQSEMALAALRQVAFSLGAPLTVAALAGIAVAVRERRGRLLALLAIPLTYYLAFMVPIRFARVRFFLPVVFLLAFFAALALERWLGWRRLPRGARVLGAGAVLAASLALPICLDLQMLGDSRYRVEAWLASRIRPGETWTVVANHPELNVRSRHRLKWYAVRRAAKRGLKPLRADYLVVNRDEARRRGGRALLAALDAGRWTYYEVFRYRARPCCGQPDWSGVSTVLTTVNPELSVYRRREPTGAPRGSSDARP